MLAKSLRPVHQSHEANGALGVYGVARYERDTLVDEGARYFRHIHIDGYLGALAGGELAHGARYAHLPRGGAIDAAYGQRAAAGIGDAQGAAHALGAAFLAVLSHTEAHSAQ